MKRMEFMVSSAALLTGISDVIKAVPAKTSHPILENFLFVAKEDGLEITASDLELTLRATVEIIELKEAGSMCVPARQTMELLKALPDQPIHFVTTTEDNFECKWSSGNSSLPRFPAGDFPEINGAKGEVLEATFPAGELSAGISATVYATGDDQMRPVMNGIFFDMDTGSTTLVATDSQKLLCYTSKDVKVDQKCSMLLHKKSANILKGLLDKTDEDVSIRFDSTTAEFRFGDKLMICRLMVGKFPDYTRVIPTNNSNVLNMDRVQLLNSVRRVSVCANRASNYIKLELRPQQLEITAQDLGFALAAYEKIDCDYNGDELNIGFKSSHLMEILSNIDCEALTIKFADARRAALILPAEEEENSGKICGILMPLMMS